MEIDARCVGQRLVIRRLVAGRGPSGGPSMTDVIGRLLSVDTHTASIERRDGSVIEIALADVVAAKLVPPRPVRSRQAIAISADNLTQITSLGWPAVLSRPLGEWELRASGGFTGRANSVAVAGDPGLPTLEAIGAVEEFYQSHDLPPLAQVVVGSQGERLFVDAGWTPVEDRPGGAIVQVAELADLPMPSDVTIATHASDEWLARYQRVDDPALARQVLEGPSTVGFLAIGDPIVAIGRVVVTGEWAGLAGVEVLASRRREGLATRIVDASSAWARHHGADKAYLQTMSDNTAALALYEPYGFTTHHAYRYLTPAHT